MAEELQALLDRINEQGIQKADAEREQRLEQAQEEAQKIITDARKEAEDIVSEAQEQAELLTEKGRASLRQAARDTVLSLRERLQERMAAVAERAVAEDLHPEALADFIASMIQQQTPEGTEASDIEAQVPKDKAEEIRKHLMRRLGDDLREKCEITPLPEMGGGFRLSLQEGAVYYDFSDKALADVLCTFLNPALAEIIKPALANDKESE